MLITRPGLQELPDLTARNRVYLLAVPEDAAAAITDAEHAGFVESVLAWPEAEEWLPCTWLGGSLGFFHVPCRRLRPGVVAMVEA